MDNKYDFIRFAVRSVVSSAIGIIAAITYHSKAYDWLVGMGFGLVVFHLMEIAQKRSDRNG